MTPAYQSLIPSQEEIDHRERVLRSTYFLVRQGDLGEILRCKRCGSKHPYFTLMCIEQPFSGITEGLFAYVHVGRPKAERKELPPDKRAQYERIAAALGTRDLDDTDPETARKIRPADPDDIDSISFALGVLEPITRQKAQQLLWRINARGVRPPLNVDGLRGGF